MFETRRDERTDREDDREHLVDDVRPPVASHTARQTKAFASIPRKNTSPNDSAALPAAVASAVDTDRAIACCHHPARHTITAIHTAPTKFPT